MSIPVLSGLEGNLLRLQPIAVTYASNITLNASAGNFFHVTLTGNVVFENPSNPSDGDSITIRIQQDGSGNRMATWGTKFQFVGLLTTVTLSTTANAIDYISFRYHSSIDKWRCVAFNGETESSASDTSALVLKAGDQMTGSLRHTEIVHTPTGTTAAINLNAGNIQTLNLGSATGTVTATITIPTSATQGTIKVKQGATIRGLTIVLSSGTAIWYGEEPNWGAMPANKSILLSWRQDADGTNFAASMTQV